MSKGKKKKKEKKDNTEKQREVSRVVWKIPEEHAATILPLYDRVANEQRAGMSYLEAHYAFWQAVYAAIPETAQFVQALFVRYCDGPIGIEIYCK